MPTPIGPKTLLRIRAGFICESCAARFRFKTTPGAPPATRLTRCFLCEKILADPINPKKGEAMSKDLPASRPQPPAPMPKPPFSPQGPAPRPAPPAGKPGTKAA